MPASPVPPVPGAVPVDTLGDLRVRMLVSMGFMRSDDELELVPVTGVLLKAMKGTISKFIIGSSSGPFYVPTKHALVFVDRGTFANWDAYMGLSTCKPRFRCVMDFGYNWEANEPIENGYVSVYRATEDDSDAGHIINRAINVLGYVLQHPYRQVPPEVLATVVRTRDQERHAGKFPGQNPNRRPY